jgi:short-subunit dehydrogenase
MRTSSKTLKSPPRRLRSQAALVTGATRGIGLAIARALASEGCNLILTARDEKALNRLSRELASAKIRVLAHSCDVRDPHSVDALFRAIRHQSPRVDILINNAGIAHPSPSRSFHSPSGRMSSRPTSTAHSSSPRPPSPS